MDKGRLEMSKKVLVISPELLVEIETKNRINKIVRLWLSEDAVREARRLDNLLTQKDTEDDS